MASCVASGPGSKWQKLSARTNSSSPIHLRRSTTSRCIRPIWPMGPPNASQPSFRKYQKISGIETRAAARCTPAWLDAASSTRPSPQRRHGEPVELGDRVRLRPDPDLAGVLKRVVRRVDHLLAIERDDETIAAHTD